ncbi:MAG TPA: DUF523 and DUF1722 domain-containing protein [Methylomirabilota bacterium]|nr:DUF523 and DUF1722 domain-containing protein [Methylomirabilota bacterium]
MNVDQPAWQVWHDESEPIRVGISSCLLGRKVRFDGGHKHDRYLTDILGAWLKWVSVCPEVEIGLGTPRPAIRLEGTAESPRLVEPKSGDDLTERMHTYSERRVGELQELDLDGYVLKRASPSCGMERVKVWNQGGMPEKNGVGIFAAVLLERWPNLPVEEEGRLNDPVLRENFVERLFCRHRWRSLVRVGLTRSRLIAFHTAHKMLLRSHNEAGYRRLGKLVASFGRGPDAEVFATYEDEFFAVLATRATVKRHANVLQHAVGYLKQALDPADRRELLGLVEDYRAGLVPLVVPITMLRHHVHRHNVEYLTGQLYLEPHPKELMLRNRV